MILYYYLQEVTVLFSTDATVHLLTNLLSYLHKLLITYILSNNCKFVISFFKRFFLLLSLRVYTNLDRVFIASRLD